MFDIDQDDQFVQISLYFQLYKTEQDIKIIHASCSYKPYASIVLLNSIGDIEKKLTLDANNFFGFTFK